MKNITSIILLLILAQWLSASTPFQETFSYIAADQVPQNYKELWDDFDPQAEPLDTEVLYEWEEDGIVIKVIRYRVGILNGKKAMVAAVFGYPKDGNNLPGLVQVHGGGQYADYRAVLTNAKRGYATISVAWAGRINAKEYKVSPSEVKLFWADDTKNPDYKVTTDWGNIGAYHAPNRFEGNVSNNIAPKHWTLDNYESPRNNTWFLWSLAARRALTFLEQQDIVNPNKLGVYGHSMGGKITVLTATDPRVKVAAPSCGGISGNDNSDDNKLFQNTIADSVYLKNITCPIIFLSPSNDFHGNLQDLPKAIDLIQTDEWRVVCSPHHSHQDLSQHEAPAMVWMDQHLKGSVGMPSTPITKLDLNTKRGTPLFTVTPDNSKQIISVDIYYTQQAINFREVSDRNNRKCRFWHHATAKKKGNSWTANLPLFYTDKTLFAYADVQYSLEDSITGAGYYYRVYDTDRYNIASLVDIVSADELKSAGVKKALQSDLMIEDFSKGWEKNWFNYHPENWGMSTHKVYNERWKAPENAKLAFEVKSEKANTLLVTIDDFTAKVMIEDEKEWKNIELTADDFTNGKEEHLGSWKDIMTLQLTDKVTQKGLDNSRIVVGSKWDGPMPEFKDLKWVE